MLVSMSEWLLLNIFLAIWWRARIIYRWDDVRFVLEQYNYICCWIFIVLSHWITEATVRGYIYRFIRAYYFDSEPTSLCVYLLMFRAKRKKKQISISIVSLWFDRTAGRTHDLLDSRRTRLPLEYTADVESFFGLILLGIEHTIYQTRGEHTNHYTAYAIDTHLNIIPSHSWLHVTLFF